MRSGLVFLVLAAFALLGCDRNIEEFQPGEQPSQPDLARIFPAPPGDIGSADGSAENADGEAGNRRATAPDRTALPPSRAEAAGSPSTMASAPGAAITGVIDLDASLAGSAPGGGILFVIARPQGARRGPPLAVLRIPAPQFPLEFSIGPDNVMIPSMSFSGALSLSARLDEDGNAMTRTGGDISSAVQEPLSPGTSDVRLVLSERG